LELEKARETGDFSEIEKLKTELEQKLNAFSEKLLIVLKN